MIYDWSLTVQLYKIYKKWIDWRERVGLFFDFRHTILKVYISLLILDRDENVLMADLQMLWFT